MVTVNSDGKRGNNMSEKIESQTVTMAHGAGGKQTSELIDKVFAAHFANPDLTADDAAVLNPPVGKMAVSTDGFIVSPAFFPGGRYAAKRPTRRFETAPAGAAAASALPPAQGDESDAGAALFSCSAR